MKKLVFVLISLLSSVAYAGYLPSPEYTDDALVTQSPGVFQGIVIATDGVHNVVISIYDHNSDDVLRKDGKKGTIGTKLLPTMEIPTSESDRYRIIFLPVDIDFKKGLYVDVTTSGIVRYIIYYK